MFLCVAIPALCPIVYDLFDTQAIGRNENTKELETQREVFISMLLRLAQFPEVVYLLDSSDCRCFTVYCGVEEIVSVFHRFFLGSQSASLRFNILPKE